MIRFENVTKSYGETIAVKNINLEIKKRDFVTVIGTSGCGKTTLIKLINGLLKPDSGTVYIEGKDISTTNQIELRRNIGYVIQSVGLFPHMSINHSFR